MKKVALVVSGIAGLILGFAVGLGLGYTIEREPASPAAAVEAESPRPETSASWTYRGPIADVEIPLDFEITRDGVETEFGYQSDFASPEGYLIVETAPRFGETGDLTLSDIADQFASSNDGVVERRRVSDIAVYDVTWTDGDQPNSQYFFTKDDMTYGLRSNAGDRADQTALLDFLVGSLTRNDQAEDEDPTPTPTTPPTPVPVIAPSDCIGDDQVPLQITNVDKYANARDRASPDATIVKQLPVGTRVNWTGEKLKNGRFIWHEVFYPDHDHCVWIAHTLLEEAPVPKTTEPIVFGPSTIAGERIGGSSTATADTLTALLGAPEGPFSTFPDSFWGPFRTGCFSFLAWDEVMIATCDDGTTAGWLLLTDAPANIKVDVDEVNSVLHWRKLANWPDDTDAYYRIDVDRWVVTSKSAGIAGIAVADTKAAVETTDGGLAREVLASSTVIDEIWSLSEPN